MKLKKGDTVLIIAGKDRGKKGKILHAFPKEEKVSVEGANLLKKHVSPQKQKQQQQGKKTGQIVEFPAPIHVSNVKLICKSCGKAVRVEKKDKQRICKKCKQET